MLAHRLAWAMANGVIPIGSLILHSCNRPPCCEPEHLYAGTQEQNMRQASEAKRLGKAKGERSAHAKLTEAQVAEIRRNRTAGEKLRSLAARFGVSMATIGKAATGRGWRQNPTPPAPLRPGGPKAKSITLGTCPKEAQ